MSKPRKIDDVFMEEVTADERVGDFIVNNVTIEHILRKLIKIKSPEKSSILNGRPNHATVIDFAFCVDVIDEKQREALREINIVRNKFAHQLFYQPTDEEIILVLDKCLAAFSNCSDNLSQTHETISEGLGEDAYGMERMDCLAVAATDAVFDLGLEVHDAQNLNKAI